MRDPKNKVARFGERNEGVGVGLRKSYQKVVWAELELLIDLSVPWMPAASPLNSA